MDHAYANALKRKEEIERELAMVNSFLDLYRHFNGPEGEQTEPRVQESLDAANNEGGTNQAARSPKPSQIADIVERVIRGAGHPLTRSEIVSRLESAGIHLNSEDKPRYVGTILWREKSRFTNIPGKGYIMADMATPYDATSDMLAATEHPDEGPDSD
ncbi:MAG: hypothetical protein EOS73_22465 [Mesorhizobium sp.]|uniref:hypothetical protein n=1 Tax=Mesorhizobium sp. M7A.F.Ca.ET.027.02.1.1 TaxID=2496655 RepID=UPI000FD47010|nr:hypothetical protein [Mesorhizobium sp. M7A.F.Ca.ET.027.02.1.1]RVD17339.1 hypothetical protein EN749_09010 [Mesorhizobium sp. M7A.F.Ca.ET.027.02.1.1]RWD02841.1 MAG: hypothetical protein EOS73_22465 [Mesorhizobium sp.]